ncbi:MAG: dethiobiotin synthase [Panacagrimonas sp.]
MQRAPAPIPAQIRAQTLFITGTDTGVGKTHIACGLLRAARVEGIDACGFKPVASGCRLNRDGHLRNADALALQAAARTEEPYARINPYAFKPAIAPHLAARAAGARIDLWRLDRVHRALAGRHDLLIVEGAGGWQVPLTASLTMADWVARHQWPVVLVVGMRLGCINHALLSAESIAQRCPLIGWIANVLPPRQPALRENIEALRRRIPAPLLGEVGARDRVLSGALQRTLNLVAAPG